MNQFRKSLRWAWSVLVVCTLAFAMGGCEGSDGAAGPTGPAGATGPAGPAGAAGADGADGVDATKDPVADKVEAANVESCDICHAGNGMYHQMEYDAAFDSDYVLTIDDVDSVGVGPYDVTIDFSIAYMGAALDVDPATSPDWPDGLSFRPSRWDDAAGEFAMAGSPFPSISGPITNNGGGSYTLTASLAYDIDSWDSGAVVGTLTDEELHWPDAPTSHFHAYDNHSTDAFEIGVGSLTADYQSLANVEGCEACHGSPYRKHANVQASVPGTSDFALCKSCHFDSYAGGHFEWQQEANDPEAWATGVAPDPAQYAYTANVMNVTHMSHAMHLPYSQSMANCATCHDGNIAEITANDFFTPETCKSCHPVEGINAWPEAAGATPEGDYAVAHRAPPLEYLWTSAESGDVSGFHSASANCQACHAPPVGGGAAAASLFADYHSGYDKTLYDATGVSYDVLAGISIDDVTIAGDLITVDFSSLDANVNPTLAISFYGWDSKHHIVPAHERDANAVDCPHNFRPGCNIEWEPGSTKPFFTEDAASVAGDWRVTFDMSGFQAYKTDPIPTLIADGVVKFAEITVMPELELADGTEVNIDAVSTSFDLGGSLIVDNYFQGANAVVDIDKCDACHDNTGVLIHGGAGRYGDSMQVCKVCHNPTFDGSHMEMQSRSIDSYVHAIHAFQPFDEADVYNDGDVVEIARLEMHKSHSIPTFTVLGCEACHNPGTYEVPSQALSMPGAQSASDTYNDPNHRLIGTIPMSVTGAAGRGCGSCHRAFAIKADDANGLVSLDAHTAAFGTFVENDPLDADGDGLEEEPVLFGIIDKIMGLFQ